VACYNPKNRHERKESERFKSFTYEELAKRDKLNLDICWLKDESLEDSANLPDPDTIAAEIDSRIPIRSVAAATLTVHLAPSGSSSIEDLPPPPKLWRNKPNRAIAVCRNSK
jgi:hypothetical protein